MGEVTKAVRAAYEQAALICEEIERKFLLPKYATDQPLSSYSERFACRECARAIRNALSALGASPAEPEDLARDEVKDQADARSQPGGMDPQAGLDAGLDAQPSAAGNQNQQQPKETLK